MAQISAWVRLYQLQCDAEHQIEIGCGGGLLTEPLKRLGANVTGLDASPEAIEVAREHALVMELDIDYRIGDLSVISNQLDQFDVVIASEVIEHVSDPQNFIHEIDKLTAQAEN